MADTSTQSLTIAGPPARVAEVVTDFEAYPEWVQAVKTVQVLSRHPDGRAHQVEFTLDAGVVKDDYVLEYDYAADASRISWHLVRGQTQRSQVGSYDLADAGDGSTTVTYSLTVELTVPMLGMFKRKAEKMIMDAALKDLKKRVES